MASSDGILFEPLKVGDLVLPNRVLMSPLTRTRSTPPGRVPNDLMKQYYVQRASAGLIFSEATSINPMGVGYPNTPGIWSDEQVEGWRHIIREVHAAGGRIFLQLWHVGRVSHSHYLDGKLPVSSSASAQPGHVHLMRNGGEYVPYETPRALEEAEIPGLVEDYRKAAENAKRAGFDGVNVHGANGYLLQQFLHDSINKRTDKYGGIIENRARLLLEVVDAVLTVWGPGRTSVHLSPRGDMHDGPDSQAPELYTYVAKELAQRKVAFISLREKEGADSLMPLIKKNFGGVVIANEGFTKQSAEKAVASGVADAVHFGKDFIANPDLPLRFARNAELNKWDHTTFYAPGPHGYTDYPLLAN